MFIISFFNEILTSTPQPNGLHQCFPISISCVPPQKGSNLLIPFRRIFHILYRRIFHTSSFCQFQRSNSVICSVGRCRRQLIYRQVNLFVEYRRFHFFRFNLDLFWIHSVRVFVLILIYPLLGIRFLCLSSVLCLNIFSYMFIFASFLFFIFPLISCFFNSVFG